jgi:hypothetical protein
VEKLGNEDWQGKPKYSEKTCPNATLSTTNLTCCPDANPGRRGGKPATTRLSYGTAFVLPMFSFCLRKIIVLLVRFFFHKHLWCTSVLAKY